MKIAIVGCAHGELEDIYETIELLQQKDGLKIDLLICCGDFQASRNEEDLKCMAVPPKYLKICTFYKYYSGEKVAPVLTIFIGGNHEASNYLQELPYGGWVAPNIYYMGYAGVINIGGLRIGGLSGIYKSRDYMKGRYEKVPYDENAKRSVYHIRNTDVFRLKQLSGKIDIFLSHDWPSDVTKYGNLKQLLKKKPFFQEDIESNQLGSEPCKELLHQLKPCFWFSAHLHCKYAALVKHDDDDSITKFLALDKCLPNRKFLQVLDIPHEEESKLEISYDLEWLTILFLTNHLLSVRNGNNFMPGLGSKERYKFTPTDEEKQHILLRFDNELKMPKNFVRTAQPYKQGSPVVCHTNPVAKLNPQTVEFCEKLAVSDPVGLVAEAEGSSLTLSLDESLNNTTFIDDSINDDISVASENSSGKKLGNLSLPKPKCDVSEEQNNVKMSSDSELDSSSESGNGTGDEEVELAQDLQLLNSPVRKKLKRRNEDLYK